jgi:hypothetical protein
MSHCDFHGNRNFGVVVDGHFARVNVTDNAFESNDCKPGLMSIRGMEKEMFILRNILRRNTGNFMVEFNMDSQSEIVGEVSAYFSRNSVSFGTCQISWNVHSSWNSFRYGTMDTTLVRSRTIRIWWPRTLWP